MKKINFSQHVLPHIVAIAAFLLVTIFFFNPVFFDNKILEQGDIQQWEGSSKALRDFREQTGEEGLWATSMFSGMPAYLVNVHWSNQIIGYTKRILALWLPHPIANIYLAFVSYYIMLLAFRVRPYLAIAGAIGFGLSTYMIIGLSAGHSARIGSIALMPLVMAGIHLAFSGKKILGFGVTTAGFALHLRENHVQITYYLAIIVAVYGVLQLLHYLKEKDLKPFFKIVALLIPAAAIGLGTFVGPLWGVTEYSAYTIRGKSELQKNTTSNIPTEGLSKDYAFEYSNGVMEPMTLLIPSIYGGNSTHFFVMDQQSETYKALANVGDQKTANQLANYTSAYWGPQSYGFAYYAGAIIVFLFALGIAFANRKYVWWLVPISILALFMSMGHYFQSFNYFLFDYLPGYNKFRSPTFALVIIIFAMPLLGLLGLENLLQNGIDKQARKKLLIVLGSTGGLCLLIMLSAGMFSFLKDGEQQLPAWFTAALADDRKSLLISDAFRSLAFIVAAFVVIYFDLRKFSPIAFYAFFIIMVMADLATVNKRYLTEEKFKRKRDNSFTTMTEADKEILKDKSYYRVYNLQGPLNEARTSYFHNSLGGYHGAKLRRYQDLFDSCIHKETNELITDVQSGRMAFANYGVLNMLNAKYIVYGTQRDNIIPNNAANGNAWFVSQVIKVNSANEELEKVCSVNTRNTAVVDNAKFKLPDFSFDSAATIEITDHRPNYLKYQSESSTQGLAVFSEIFYEKGWKAFIDGKETNILRANYVLRAMIIPAGKHIIEFKFVPAAYTVGNTITLASSWLMLIVLLGSIGYTIKSKDN